jgi:lipocalin-like protein
MFGKTGSYPQPAKPTRMTATGQILLWSGRAAHNQISTWGDTMNKALVAVGLGLTLSSVAFAEEKSAKEQIVGAWTLVSVTSEMDDGNRGEPFGPSPKGVIIFSNDGHFSLFQSRAEIAK